MTWPVVALTGHWKLGAAEEWVRAQLAAGIARLRDQGTHTGRSGMALGADTIWAEEILDAGLQLHAVVPFEAQADQWPAHARLRWERLRAGAHAETVVGPNPRDYVRTVAALHYRNQVLLDPPSAGCIAVWDGRERGGTWQAVRYARKIGLPIVWVDPVRRVVERVT
ncbi:LOG family protein [Catenuloplanes japonicus]|uniref:hypothetical protein n=1 Tax=Catenuloplanes japonicus TaxID=33876 RepID=UPI0005277955|nr:hypothetical protein [Catenuloplanes japonicus]